MKNTLKLGAITFFISMSVSSCVALPTFKKEEDEEADEKRLVIRGDFKKEYLQHEILDLSGMEVYEVHGKEEKKTDLFYIVDLDGTKVDDSYTLEKVGDLTFHVRESGYKCTSFRVTVEGKGALVIDSYANERTYHIGDDLSLEGMKVGFQKGTGSSASKTPLTNYNIDIADEDGNKYPADGFVFKKKGTYIVLISTIYNGTKYQTNFMVTCNEEDSSLPEELGQSFQLMNEDSDTMNVKITRPGDKGVNEYYPSNKVKLAMTANQYGEKSYLNWSYTPSVGRTPLLVIPTVIPGYEDYTDLNKAKNVINDAFFGSSDKLNFESLHSYYYKSSYGKLDFTGRVTDFYRPDQNPNSEFKKESDFTQAKVGSFIQEAVDWAAEKYHLDLDYFDTDDNGTVDGVWVVYVHPTETENKNLNRTFWAFSGTTQRKGSLTHPLVNNYGWAGIDFLDTTYQDKGKDGNPDNPDCGLDAHVIIHETGHMLGLPDYYSYAESTYAPLGRIDIMDSNVGDQNPFSKMMLGWVTPNIVYGNATIKLNTSSSKDSLIVIPYDDKKYEKDEEGNIIFNPYDEYLIVDFYSSSNLNNQGYWAYNVDTIKGKGGRIYHVDNRILEVDENKHFYFPEDPDHILQSTGNNLYGVITNTEKGTSAEKAITHEDCYIKDEWDQLRWISKDKRKLAKYDSNTKHEAEYGKNDELSRLFMAGDMFSLNMYSASFVGGKLDSGKNFNSVVQFAS